MFKISVPGKKMCSSVRGHTIIICMFITLRVHGIVATPSLHCKHVSVLYFVLAGVLFCWNMISPVHIVIRASVTLGVIGHCGGKGGNHMCRSEHYD